MFKELSELLDSANLSMTLSKKGDKISVTVIPKAKKDNDSLSNTPLIVCGTAEELDEKLVDEIQTAIGANVGYFSNAETVSAAIKEESLPNKKEQKTTPAAKETPKTEEKKKALNATQKKAVEKATASLEKAKKEKDPDMIEFLRKSAVKLMEDAKVPAEDIEAVSKQFKDIKPAGATQGDAFANSENSEESSEENNEEENDNVEEDNNEENNEEDNSGGGSNADDDIF
jgi:PRTRC genetic system protein E